MNCSAEAMDIDATNGVTNKRIFDYIKKNLDYDHLIWEFGIEKNTDWIRVSSKENRKRILKSVKDENPVYHI